MTADGTSHTQPLDRTASPAIEASSVAAQALGVVSQSPKIKLSDLLLEPAIAAASAVKIAMWACVVPILVGLGIAGLLDQASASRSATIVGAWLLGLGFSLTGLILAVLSNNSNYLVRAREAASKRAADYRSAFSQSGMSHKAAAAALEQFRGSRFLQVLLLAGLTLFLTLAASAIGAAAGIPLDDLPVLANTPAELRSIRIVRIVTWLGATGMLVPHALQLLFARLALPPPQKSAS